MAIPVHVMTEKSKLWIVYNRCKKAWIRYKISKLKKECVS